MTSFSTLCVWHIQQADGTHVTSIPLPAINPSALINQILPCTYTSYMYGKKIFAKKKVLFVNLQTLSQLLFHLPAVTMMTCTCRVR